MSQLNQINKIAAAANDTRLIEQELAVYTYMIVNEQVHTLESLMTRFSVRLPATVPETLFTKVSHYTPGDMRRTLRLTLELSLRQLKACGYVVGDDESGWRCL